MRYIPTPHPWQARFERLRQRTEDARLQRHASVLRRLWQTQARLTRGDAVAGVLLLASVGGIALTWRAHLQEVRQQQQQLQQELAPSEPPPLRVAAVATAAPPSA